jgi:hypothetical protein
MEVPSRLSPTEFVETLGDLYRQARAASTAVDIGFQAARSRLSRRLGLPASATARQIGDALDARREPHADWLERCERAAADPHTPAGEALRLLQGLHGELERLQAMRRSQG